MKASIRTDARDLAVDVLDVSEMRMRLGVPEPFSDGQAITVVTPRLQLSGSVMWSKDGEVGVKLDRRLSSNQMTELSGLSPGI